MPLNLCVRISSVCIQLCRPDVLNVVSNGSFSSDRTIGDYAQNIWQAEPCPVSLD